MAEVAHSKQHWIKFLTAPSISALQPFSHVNSAIWICGMADVAILLVQAALLLPLFIFCYYMYEWETDEANQVLILSSTKRLVVATFSMTTMSMCTLRLANFGLACLSPMRIPDHSPYPSMCALMSKAGVRVCLSTVKGQQHLPFRCPAVRSLHACMRLVITSTSSSRAVDFQIKPRERARRGRTGCLMVSMQKRIVMGIVLWQVPILPNEGEELPCNVKGPRQMREATFLTTLERSLSGAGAMAA